MAMLPLRTLGNEGLFVISVASFIQMPVDFGSLVMVAMIDLTLNVQTLRVKSMFQMSITVKKVCKQFLNILSLVS